MSNMPLLIFFLIAIQMVPSPPLPFLFPSCNSPEVKAAAEAALDKLNADRKEGYVLGLQRIFDAHEVPQRFGGSVFYLRLDVLETGCHVESGRKWKECKFRQPYETVYGQCKVIIHFKRNADHSKLYSYDCALHSLPPSDIQKNCPDCPTPGNCSEDIFQKIAAETLAKYNAENNYIHYFGLWNVTKASSQWVVGLAYFVEYIIQETSCRKSPPVSDITQCPFLTDETAKRGLCKGSVINSQIEKKKFVTVKCDLFPRPPPVTGEQSSQPKSRPEQEEHHHDGERQRDHDEEQRHHHRHSRPHIHRQDGQSQEHQEPHHHHPSAGIKKTSSKQNKPIEQVIIDLSSSKLAVPEVQEPNSTSRPRLASPEQEASARSVKPAEPAIPPFPRGFSQSAECPGEVAIEIPGLELPSRPQAETS